MAPVIHYTKIQEGDRSLKLVFSTLNNNFFGEQTSPDYDIGHYAQARFKFQTHAYGIETSASFKVHELQNDVKAQITVTCNIESYTRHMVCPHEWSEFVKIGEHKWVTSYDDHFLSVIIVDVTVCPPSWKILYNDDFTDFELSSEDGSVSVHRVVMAAHSEVFKTMLNGEWKETEKQSLEVKGVTLETLQHLKDYMYLGSLPEHEHLRPLLLIAKCYIMHCLEQACIFKMVRTVKPEDLLDLIKFATDNHLSELNFAIVKNTCAKVVTDSEGIHKVIKLKNNTQ